MTWHNVSRSSEALFLCSAPLSDTLYCVVELFVTNHEAMNVGWHTFVVDV
jgi:hypothetical protein